MFKNLSSSKHMSPQNKRVIPKMTLFERFKDKPNALKHEFFSKNNTVH